MNSIYIVDLLLENAERFSSEFYEGSYDLDTGIKDMLLELNNRRPLNIPPDFNDTIQSLVATFQTKTTS